MTPNDGRQTPRPQLSVLVPAYNEEEVLEEFYRRTVPVLEGAVNEWEIVFVDDGSRDRTVEVVTRLHGRDPRVKLIILSRNFGKETAMAAGLDYTDGDAVAILDADLQDPPELIPAMLEKMAQGYDTVYATRNSRMGETFLKKATANLFYKFIGRLTRVSIPRNTGDFRVMNRRTVEALRAMRERHRFSKGMFAWVGFKQTGILYDRDPRHAGETKWNYWKLWNFAIEGITSFSIAPLIFATYLGLLVALFSFCYAIYLVGKVLVHGIDVPGYASLMVAILFLSGVQLISLGIIGEYVGRIFNETKSRPLYLIDRTIGL